MPQIATGFVSWLASFYFKLRVKEIKIVGRENLPTDDKGYVLVSNHRSYIDPILIWLITKKAVRFWMKTDIMPLGPFNIILVWLVKVLFNTITVTRNKVDLSPIRKSKPALEKGDWIGIFPEGTRNKMQVPVLQAGHVGATILAWQTKVKVIPIAIQGTKGLFNPFGFTLFLLKFWEWGRQPIITVNIGKPFSLPENSLQKSERSASHTHFILYKIAQLLPSELQGSFATESI